jgi:hypothetical protein
VPVALSGIGVASAGGTDINVHDNWITGNVPSGPVRISGGLVVFKQRNPTATAPTHNHMTDNVVRGNSPDVFWDGTGTDNRFFDNHCETSVPAGICK